MQAGLLSIVLRCVQGVLEKYSTYQASVWRFQMEIGDSESDEMGMQVRIANLKQLRRVRIIANTWMFQKFGCWHLVANKQVQYMHEGAEASSHRSHGILTATGAR